MKHLIKKIGFHDEYGNPQVITLKKNGVKEIKQHSAQGEGDKWYYEVVFEDNKMLMIFDPKIVEYEKADDDCPF